MARSRCEIVSDILETVKEEEDCKKTTIIRLANLDWDMANEYLDILLDLGHLETYEDESKGKDSYKLTEEGEKLLDSMGMIKEICSSFRE